MENKLKELKTILADVDDLQRAASVLNWDQQANMPAAAAEARGYQMGTLSRIAHETFTDEKVGKLLEALKPAAAEMEPDSDDACLIKVTAREYKRSTKVPPEMVAEKAQLTAVGNQAWQEARAKSDFPLFQPHMEKIVDWSKRFAELFAPYDHIYDPLLDGYEPGMKTAEVQAIFDGLKGPQSELIHAIAEKPQVDDSFLHLDFDEQKQWDFGVEAVTQIGYDWKRGREDKVTHPFSTNLGYGDQRITTRVYDDFFNTHLFATLHEAGHALYEQGIGPELARTPLYGGTSLAIHESQSRLWENLVGRSHQFWTFNYPRLQEFFPSQFGNVDLESFYKGINKVEPSFIRVEADEATYNLHIMLRMELEIELLEGKLAVKDLPEVWNERFNQYLGVTPPDDAEGVLQDVHWSFGLYGYFSTYALGNLISVQIWEAVKKDLPDLEDLMAAGKFSDLHKWLREKIYRHGSKFEPQELVQRVTGSKIDGTPYLRYLQSKFGEIYGL